MSTLSICTICQDEEEPIRWYLESCAHLAANCPGLKEVVLVDGGSKDDTIDVINSYRDKVPIVLLERPWDYTQAQINFGLEHCTGDFIFDVDADMTWTTNFPEVFNSGRFDPHNMWDFPMLFTARDAYHYFYKWPNGVSMRLFKRGPKFTRKYHISLEGQHPGLPVCGEVVIFENSCRIKSDKALLWRGERRQVCIKDMADEGASPGPADRFYGAAHAPDSEIQRLSDNLIPLILPSTNG